MRSRFAPLLVRACFTESASATTASPTATSVAEKKTFDQDEVNKIVKKERDTHLEKMSKLSESLKLTDAQRNELAAQIDAVKAEKLTEVERLNRDILNQKNQYEDKVKGAVTEAENWKNRYTSSTINSSIIGAAAKENAYNPEQVNLILQGKARLVQKTDTEGKPIDDFIVKVKVDTKDTKGAAITLDVGPDEAVKLLKDSADFANLFKGTQTPGLGGNSGKAGQKIDISNLTPEQYRKLRKDNPAALGL